MSIVFLVSADETDRLKKLVYYKAFNNYIFNNYIIETLNTNVNM